MENKFKINTTYETRSVCGIGCIFSFKVIRRTAKSVWIKGAYIKGERRTITVRDGIEVIYPLGKYSMAPVLRANKESN